MPEDIFGCHSLGGGSTTGFQQVEARDAIKHLVMCRIDSHTKNYPAQNVNSAKIEKSGLSLCNKTASYQKPLKETFVLGEEGKIFRALTESVKVG